MIDNRPGAGSNIGAAVAARAQPDGTTILIGTDALMTSNAHLYKTMPFDPVKDFAPVTVAGLNTIALTVNAELPVKTVPELIAYAKANPGKLQYGTPGIASPHHLSGELLRRQAGIDIVHVPYRGGGPAANDLVGGHINMAFLSLSTAVPILPTGKIRIVALVERTVTPRCPTCRPSARHCRASRCRPGSACSCRPRRRRRSSRGSTRPMRKILLDPPIKEKLATLGLVVAPGAPAELADRIKRGLALRGELIKAANIQPE